MINGQSSGQGKHSTHNTQCPKMVEKGKPALILTFSLGFEFALATLIRPPGTFSHSRGRRNTGEKEQLRCARAIGSGRAG